MRFGGVLVSGNLRSRSASMFKLLKNWLPNYLVRVPANYCW
jgi:hypothetical protein